MPPQESIIPPMTPQVDTTNGSPAKEEKKPESPENETAAAETNADDHKPPEDFDDILPYLGEFGLYQKILFLLLAPFLFFVAYVYFAQIFITLTPPHWCHIPELEGLTAEQR
ncbi:hypothetical protein J437_LFUL003664 [Ladona fulva]|uniref:Uncharacterized protein n=1 Tax=Ladona fulva TaxID=123851 RepID=A0A8K0K8V1_LADFU|nr:hypothetical protein J437_LFUL003664 [Ladona fulva]